MITLEQRYAGLAAAPRRQLEAAAAALQARDLDGADAGLAALPVAVAQHPEALRLRGLLAYRRGDAAAALEPLVTALRQRPADALICTDLGACYERLGDLEHALKAFEMACNAAPDDVGHWVNFGRVLTSAGWLQHATAVLQHAVQLAPQNAAARTMLATSLAAIGDNAGAVAAYRQLVGADPSNGLAWWGLAIQKPMPLTPADVSAMQTAAAADDLRPEMRRALLFALALGHEHAGDMDAAWQCLDAAHALARRDQAPWDGATFERDVARDLALFADPPPAAPTDPGREVIFIVSLPRSGSTLVEQILASHSTVAGTSELPDLTQTLEDMSAARQRQYPDWVSDCTPAAWHDGGRRYLARTARWRQGRPRMTDKMPGNWQNIGAILRLLPNARIVVVRRDAVETCLACWRVLLEGHDYAQRLEDLARYWRVFEHTVTTWQQRCPERVKVVDYEALTAQPEAQIRALLTFCDLPFEAACLAPQATARRVSTISAAQVREPIHAATSRAASYGTRLDPLRRALALGPES